MILINFLAHLETLIASENWDLDDGTVQDMNDQYEK